MTVLADVEALTPITLDELVSRAGSRRGSIGSTSFRSSFGPGLVQNGAVLPGIDDVEIDTNFGNHSVQGQQPRTAVGMVAANHLLFVVVDGRSTGYSRGVTMTELAQIFVDRGATVAYNLDGGGSSAMVFQGGLVNNPLGKGEERGTSDILYVAG